MQDARLETGSGEGALDQPVIAAGAFNGYQAIAELVVGEGLADLRDGGFEVRPVVGDVRRWDDDPAVEVGEEELGTYLGAVKAEDTEVLGPDFLDARMENTARLAGGFGGSAPGGTVTGTSLGHEKSLPKDKGLAHPIVAADAQARLFFEDKTHIPGDAPLFLTWPALLLARPTARS